LWGDAHATSCCITSSAKSISTLRPHSVIVVEQA
jgi:hypothetical protein